jgi:KUP system potassium uptake protein
MASVYGLTIAISMLTTTVMLFVYHRRKQGKVWPIYCLLAVFGLLETLFLAASMEKLLTGGVVTFLMTLFLLAAMLSWDRGEAIERRFSARLPLRDYLAQLEQLRADTDYLKTADNLVYIDRGSETETVDQAILYSVLDRGPKRAEAYWFVSVNTDSEPYLQRYQVETFGTDCVFRLNLDLGYKCSRPLTWYLKEVFLDMERKRLAPISRKPYCLSEDSELGTFHYCVLRRRGSGAESLSTTDLWAMRMRSLLQGLTGIREEWYTEENTDVEVEWIPLSLIEEAPIERIRRLLKDPEASDKSEIEK